MSEEPTAEKTEVAEETNKEGEGEVHEKTSKATVKTSIAGTNKSDEAQQETATSKQGDSKLSLGRRSTVTSQTRRSHQGSLSSLSRKLVPITSIQIMEAGTGHEIFKVKVRKFLPTYRLESQNPFNVDKASRITKAVVDDALEGAVYDPKDSLGYIKIIGREIRKKLRRENYDRYRIVIFIILGQKKMQGIQCRSYAIWDAEKDSQCNYLFENMSMFCSVSVYGVYQD